MQVNIFAPNSKREKCESMDFWHTMLTSLSFLMTFFFVSLLNTNNHYTMNDIEKAFSDWLEFDRSSGNSIVICQRIMGEQWPGCQIMERGLYQAKKTLGRLNLELEVWVGNNDTLMNVRWRCWMFYWYDNIQTYENPNTYLRPKQKCLFPATCPNKLG